MTLPAPLYQRVMGDAWAHVAEPVRLAHATRSVIHAHGGLHVERGPNRMARVVAAMLRLPRRNAAAETRLTVTACRGGERWERIFDGRRIRTWQYESRPLALAERFGVVDFRFALEARNGGVIYVQREASFVLGPVRVRIPDGLAPRVVAREDPAGARQITVNVRVTLPILGLLIAYDGVVELEDVPA